MAVPPESNRKRKTKLEKIAELESKVKILNEENSRFRREIHSLKSTGVRDGVKVAAFPEVSAGSSGSEEKLKEAIRALKRVSVKQEVSLTALRSKARQRRAELDHKDKCIERLEEQLKAMEKAHERLKGNGTGDVGALRARLADLELKLAKEEAGKQEQSKELIASKEDVSTIRTQLDNLKGRMHRVSSSKSLRSTDSSNASSSEDLARLKRELAKKTEKIVILENDLEEARDEIFQLRKRKQTDASFPTTPAPAGADDFFSDNEDDEDEFWGT